MIAPILLLLLSLTGMISSVWFYGPVLSDAFLICAISTVAAIILILIAGRRPRPKYIVIDGSNVMHWHKEQPLIGTVRRVLKELTQQGYVPVVWFDANVGYKIGNRYLGPVPLSKMLGIPARHVFVAPKGTPADPLLLDGAAKLKAKVVSNDRFRDWLESHPQTKKPGFLIKGYIRGDKVVLDDFVLDGVA